MQIKYKITYKSGRVAEVDEGIFIKTGEPIERIDKIDPKDYDKENIDDKTP